MSKSTATVLLLGGTGQSGMQVASQMLQRGVKVKAIVRSAGKMPKGTEEVIGSIGKMSQAEFQKHLTGCTAVVSCLGHRYGWTGSKSPSDFITHTTRLACEGARAVDPRIKVICVSGAGLSTPTDPNRGPFIDFFCWMAKKGITLFADQQVCLDMVAASYSDVRWCIVRPFKLVEGPITKYDNAYVSFLVKTNLGNVAHFLCELVENDDVFEKHERKAPYLRNAE